MTPTSHEIFIGSRTKVTVDKRSKTRIVSCPFEFPDETKGVLILCRVKDEDWTPSKEILSITINFTEKHENKTVGK